MTTLLLKNKDWIENAIVSGELQTCLCLTFESPYSSANQGIRNITSISKHTSHPLAGLVRVNENLIKTYE